MKKTIALLAFVFGVPGCMVVPLAEPVPAYVAPSRPVVVHPPRHHYRNHYWRGPRYAY
jgi:hypothetical protein